MADFKKNHQQNGEAMQIEEDIRVLLTCKKDLHCPHEAACFRLGKFAESIINERRTEKALEPTDSDEVAHYAPDWETARPDWSEA